MVHVYLENGGLQTFHRRRTLSLLILVCKPRHILEVVCSIAGPKYEMSSRFYTAGQSLNNSSRAYKRAQISNNDLNIKSLNAQLSTLVKRLTNGDFNEWKTNENNNGIKYTEGFVRINAPDFDVLDQPLFRVDGSVRIEGGLQVDGNIDGNVQTVVALDGLFGSMSQTSDRRIKTNIEPLSDGLAILKRMKPVRFLDREKKKRIGFIAQDLEDPSVIPEVVVQKSEDGLRSVRYGDITAVLTNAIQDLVSEVTKLKTRIARIERHLHLKR